MCWHFRRYPAFGGNEGQPILRDCFCALERIVHCTRNHPCRTPFDPTSAIHPRYLFRCWVISGRINYSTILVIRYYAKMIVKWNPQVCQTWKSFRFIPNRSKSTRCRELNRLASSLGFCSYIKYIRLQKSFFEYHTRKLSWRLYTFSEIHRR